MKFPARNDYLMMYVIKTEAGQLTEQIHLILKLYRCFSFYYNSTLGRGKNIVFSLRKMSYIGFSYRTLDNSLLNKAMCNNKRSNHVNYNS